MGHDEDRWIFGLRYVMASGRRHVEMVRRETQGANERVNDTLLEPCPTGLPTFTMWPKMIHSGEEEEDVVFGEVVSWQQRRD
jgi:hypothetical protein